MNRETFFPCLRNNISLRIFVLLAAGIVVGAITLNAVLYSIQQRRLDNEFREQGQRLVSLFIDSIRLAVYTGSTRQLAKPAASLLRQDDILSVCIYDAEERLLFGDGRGLDAGDGSDPTCVGLYGESNGADPAQLVVIRQPIYAALSPSSAEELYFDLSQEEYRQKIGHALVTLSREKLVLAKRTDMLQTVIVCIAFLAIILPLVYFIIVGTTRPLRELLVKIRQQVKGDETAVNDLVLLDQTFSSMVEELEQSFLKINNFKVDLERKVAERTQELTAINSSLERALADLKATQMQLVHSEKMASLGLLSTGLAHEINNALTIIKGAIPPLKERIDEVTTAAGLGDQQPAGISSTMEHIEAGVQRIMTLLRDLMTFAQPSREMKRFVDINTELGITINLLTVESGKEIDFVTEFTPVPPVMSFGNQLSQVFFNILLNAVQSIDREGVVRIRTAVEGHEVVVRITDNGCGISEEVLPKIFDPFFTTKEVGKGTGLGLGICHSIIGEHHGQIQVESNWGEGTDVSIRLPAITSPG